MKWSWNFREVASPQTGPVEMTVVSCNCRLFGGPYWNDAPTGGTPHWDQRAWLDGEQTVEFEVRAVSAGSTILFITGFVGRPFTTTNPVEDHTIYQMHFLSASVIP
jgi:hypothetical protein